MLNKIKLLSMFVLFIVVGFVTGCVAFVTVTNKIEVDYSSIPIDITVNDFDLSKIIIKATKPKEVVNIALSEKYLSKEDFDKLKTPGTHKITVYYDELTTQFSVTLLEKYSDITVSFSTGTSFDDRQIKFEKYSFVEITEVPIKEAYVFDGWYLESELINKFVPKKLSKDITLYARWKGLPNTISFDFGYELPDYGKVLEKQIVNSGQCTIPPALLLRDGYRFVGWFTDKAYTNVFDFDEPIESSFIVYAKWEQK